ncbi:unnamed protein product [Heterobilharzia americana]|nr:unnamed protein product [Heterobilharzia americana]
MEVSLQLLETEEQVTNLLSNINRLLNFTGILKMNSLVRFICLISLCASITNCLNSIPDNDYWNEILDEDETIWRRLIEKNVPRYFLELEDPIRIQRVN